GGLVLVERVGADRKGALAQIDGDATRGGEPVELSQPPLGVGVDVAGDEAGHEVLLVDSQGQSRAIELFSLPGRKANVQRAGRRRATRHIPRISDSYSQGQGEASLAPTDGQGEAS